MRLMAGRTIYSDPRFMEAIRERSAHEAQPYPRPPAPGQSIPHGRFNAYDKTEQDKFDPSLFPPPAGRRRVRKSRKSRRKSRRNRRRVKRKTRSRR